MKIGFFGLLTVLFVGLKLGEVITWSWWLVLLPAYGGLALGVLIFFLVALFLAISEKG
jgi:hypothetical protein